MQNRAERKNTMLKTMALPLVMGIVGIVVLAICSFLALKGVEQAYESIMSKTPIVEVKINQPTK